MSKHIISIFLIFTSTLLIAQSEQPISILDADTAIWGKEVFSFPLSFADGINYQGTEEARFPTGWIDQKSDNFWSYVFAWKINYQDELTAEELEKNIVLYYDGLMRIDHKRASDPSIQNTVALFIQNTNTSYTGKIKTFDAFATKKPFSLNARVEKYDCPDKRYTTVVFRLSPKPFDSDVWQYLEEVKISSEVCRE